MTMRWRIARIPAVVIGAVMLLTGCGAPKPDGKPATRAMGDIASVEQFKAVLNGAGDKLLGFDLYADWCMPCRILTPQLEKLAGENKAKVTFYRINVDKLPQLASTFNVNGIPDVVFVRRGTAIAALVGLQPIEEYARIINGALPSAPPAQTADANGGSGGLSSAGAALSFRIMNTEDVRKLIATSSPVILDVRTQVEYEKGHIAGALLLPLDRLADSLSAIAKFRGADIIVYCYSGNRSLSASRVLAGHGFTKVINMKGGIMDWKRRGYPLETPAVPQSTL